MNMILVNNQNLDLEKDSFEFSENKSYFVEVESIDKEFSLNVKEDTSVKIEILARNSNLNFNIELNENSHLTFNVLIVSGSINLNSNLNRKNASINSSINIISKNDSNNMIKINHLASNTVSNIKNHGFSLDGSKLVFDVDSKVIKEASKCISHQDNQIIESIDSLSKINPNLYIDNYDIEASHAAYIGKFKDSELFYLMSRGISRKDSYLLLLKAFLTSSFTLEKDKFIDSIIDYYSK